jgi:hypothetical protein
MPRSLAGSKIWISDRLIGNRACGRGVRDGLHGVVRRAKFGRLHVGGPDERARVILGGVREIDQDGRVSSERQRLIGGFRRTCEKHQACVA